MAFKLDLFDDFHLHGASAPEWQQRYLQLSPGAMRSALVEATAGRLHVFRKWMSERVVQQGCLPAGQRCFAMLGAAGGGTARLQGHEIHGDRLFILRGGDEFMLQRPKGMALLAVTFDAADFERLLQARPWAAPALALLAGKAAVQAPAASLRQLQSELGALLSTPTDGGTAAAAVFEALGALFAHAAAAPQPFGSASASFIVAECHRIVAASGDAPPSVEWLCRRLRTSRRSLQNSFRQVADTTPLHYLRSVRLNAVRRRLLAVPPAAVSVAQAASDEGFGHLSHFAERYRTLFGELPSQTHRGR